MKVKKINFKLCVVGLGYVGLPLLIELSKYFDVGGYDISNDRISNLKKGFDKYNQVKKKDINKKIFFFNDPAYIKKYNFLIITVPTPVNNRNVPDLFFLKKSCIEVGKNLKQGSVIVFESTVYPGVTNDFCIPLLEKNSKLKYKKSFNVGYSPERISVGDNYYTLKNITKVISGDSEFTIKKIKYVYSKIIKNIYIAKNIEVAEFSKVLENTQRDLNISLMNELSIICNKMKISSHDVINAASTKWNFHKYNPGLVGGHCIGVDPYYLSYKAKKIGYKPIVINASRYVNDKMSNFIYKEIINKTKLNDRKNKKLKILFLGLTFKENCKDIRNSKIFDVIKKFQKKKHQVFLNDPYAIKYEVEKLYDEKITEFNKLPSNFDVVVISVPHKFYLQKGFNLISKFNKKNSLFVDLKSSFINIKNKNLKLMRL